MRHLLAKSGVLQIEIKSLTGVSSQGRSLAVCFSAAANFVGSGVLGAVGVVTLTKVKHRRELHPAHLDMSFACCSEY
jgi:hypothetical protein